MSLERLCGAFGVREVQTENKRTSQAEVTPAKENGDKSTDGSSQRRMTGIKEQSNTMQVMGGELLS